MANEKITELTALTTPDAADLLAIVDDPSGTPVTKKITVANLLSLAAAAFDYLQYRDQKAQNTAGGTFTSGAWRTRDLNTEVSDSGPAAVVNRHQARLQNVTDATTVLTGTTEYTYVNAGDGSQSRSLIEGRFTIASAKAFEIQHQCQTTAATGGFGVAANFTTEVYTVVELWKIG